MSFLRRAWTWLYGQPYLLATITMTFWAANFIVGRGVRGDVPPVTLAMVRWYGAFLVVAPFAWRYLKADLPAMLRGWKMLVMLSVIGITCFNTFAYTGLQYSTAMNGLLLQSSLPIMIAVFVFAIYRERLNLFQALGIALSLAGVVYVIVHGDITRLLTLSFNIGDLWMLAGFLTWALYTALLRERPNIHWLSFLAVTFLIGVLVLTPFGAWELASGRVVNFTWTSVGGMIYVALFPSVIAYICYNRAVELAGANAIGPLFHLIPVLGSFMAIAVLGERLELYHLIGFVVVMAGIWLASRKPARRKAEKRA